MVLQAKRVGEWKGKEGRRHLSLKKFLKACDFQITFWEKGNGFPWKNLPAYKKEKGGEVLTKESSTNKQADNNVLGDHEEPI